MIRLDRAAQELGLDRDSHLYFERTRLGSKLAPVVRAILYSCQFVTHENDQYFQFVIPKGVIRLKTFTIVNQEEENYIAVQYTSQQYGSGQFMTTQRNHVSVVTSQ